jgi:hypothetical protein
MIRQRISIQNCKGKKFYKNVLVLLFALLLILPGSIAAYAGTASGPTLSWSNFGAYNHVQTSPNSFASANTPVKSTLTAPSGYLGSQARLYRAGTLYGYTSTYYSTSQYAANSYWNGPIVMASNPSSDSYYSKGFACGYSPSLGDYTYGNPAKSPSQNA